MKLLGTHLDALLRHWEDYNLIAEALFTRYLATKKFFSPVDDKQGILTPMIGSELNRLCALVRPIAKFNNLRRWLESPHQIPIESPYQFLPRVPRDYIGRVNQFNLARSQEVPNQVFIPYMLQQWGEVRRALVVESGSIDPLDLRKEYWLDALPYPSLYIRCETGLTLDSSKIGDRVLRKLPTAQWDLNNILVSAGDDGETHILVWSDTIHDACLFTDDVRRSLSRSVREVSVASKGKIMKALEVSTAITDGWIGGFCGIASVIQGGVGVSYDKNFNRVTSSVFAEAHHDTFAKLLMMLNRICRICAEAYTSDRLVTETGALLVQPEGLAPRDARPWHEIDISRTIEVGKSRKNSARMVVKRVGGYTVQPHYRMKHMRMVWYKENGEWRQRAKEIGAVVVNRHLIDDGQATLKSGGIQIVK